MKRFFNAVLVLVLMSVIVNSAIAELANVPETYTATIGLTEKQTPLVLVKIKAGSFMMGDDRFSEKPAHKVTLSKDFYIGKYELTQAQWSRFAENKSEWKGDNRPVNYVSRNDGMAFCDWLNKNDKTKPAGFTYRLPTEAEWEYVCRAGTKTAFFTGEDCKGLEDYAWHECNGNGEIHDVGTKKPNPWGIHDICGNVWEWCQELHAPYKTGDLADPYNPPREDQYDPDCVLRGGWLDGIDVMRSSRRHYADSRHTGHNVGFRIVLYPEIK